MSLLLVPGRVCRDKALKLSGRANVTYPLHAWCQFGRLEMAKAIQKYLHTNSKRFLSINLLTKKYPPIHASINMANKITHL